MANPAGHQGDELVAAGLFLLLAGYVPERGPAHRGGALGPATSAAKGSLEGYDPSR